MVPAVRPARPAGTVAQRRILGRMATDRGSARPATIRPVTGEDADRRVVPAARNRQRPTPRVSATSSSRPDTAQRLTAVLTGLMAVQAVLGLAVPRLYRDIGWVRAAWTGNDAVTLVVAVPLLVGVLVAVRRGSGRAVLVRAGLLAYAAYDYAFYLLRAELNALFPMYAVLAVLAVTTLVVVLVDDRLFSLRCSPGCVSAPSRGRGVGRRDERLARKSLQRRRNRNRPMLDGASCAASVWLVGTRWVGRVRDAVEPFAPEVLLSGGQVGAHRGGRCGPG